jgi:hypothetical protein
LPKTGNFHPNSYLSQQKFCPSGAKLGVTKKRGSKNPDLVEVIARQKMAVKHFSRLIGFSPLLKFCGAKFGNTTIRKP